MQFLESSSLGTGWCWPRSGGQWHGESVLWTSSLLLVTFVSSEPHREIALVLYLGSNVITDLLVLFLFCFKCCVTYCCYCFYGVMMMKEEIAFQWQVISRLEEEKTCILCLSCLLWKQWHLIQVRHFVWSNNIKIPGTRHTPKKK